MLELALLMLALLLSLVLLLNGLIIYRLLQTFVFAGAAGRRPTRR